MTGRIFASDRPFLVIGRAGMDLYADPPGTRIEDATRFTTALGGSSANIAVALVRQGCAAALLTCVSDDAVGRFTLNELARYGIDTRHVRKAGGARNTLAVVETRNIDTQSVIYRNGAADFEMTELDVIGVDYDAYAALVVTGTALAAEPSRGAVFAALARARAAGIPCVLDIDYRPYSWPSAQFAARTCAKAAVACDLVIGNDEEWALLSGGQEQGIDTARALVRANARIVIYKMGPEGAVTITPDGEISTGIYRTRALKPTGAGDSFLGAFLAALAQGEALRAAVLRGSAAAAMVVARVGCAPAMPDRAELDTFIAGYAGNSPA